MENLFYSMSRKDIAQTVIGFIPSRQGQATYYMLRSLSTLNMQSETATSANIKKKKRDKVSYGILKKRGKSLKLQSSNEVGKQKVVEGINAGALKSLELALSECEPHSTEQEVSSTWSGGNWSGNEQETGAERSIAEGGYRRWNTKFNDDSCSGANKSKVEKVSRKLHDNSHDTVCTYSDIKGSEFQKCSKRLNEANIQMLSQSLFQQLFGRDKDRQSPTPDQVRKACRELEKHHLLNAEKTLVDDVDLKLPKLEGCNIEEHFCIIGEQQCAPYRELLKELIVGIPNVPKEWVLQPGWTRYANDTKPQSVPFPQEDAIVFDVEVCLSVGKMPTLATAVSSKAWYAWVGLPLVEGAVGSMGQDRYLTDHLIPLETGPLQHGVGRNRKDLGKPRIVVGHNVSYDRARVKEQYWLESTGTRFIDTMSMHICISGVTSYQRAMLKASPEDENGEGNEWRKNCSLNSLNEVHKLYCGSPVDKESRDVFVNGTLSDVMQQFQELTTYCAGDVIATHGILCKLLPLFLDRFPHPVTLAGMLELSTAYLPVNSNWCRYLSDSQQTFEDLDSEARFLLARQADEACQLLHKEKYREDIWLWDQDWSIQEIRLKKSKPVSKKSVSREEEIIEIGKSETENEKSVTQSDDERKNRARKNKDAVSNYLNTSVACQTRYNNDRDEVNSFTNNGTSQGEDFSDIEEDDSLAKKFKYLEDTRTLLPARMPHLPGYPAWYRKLCQRPSDSDWVPGPQLISTSMQVTPKLLSLTWELYPLHYIRNHGWGFLVPYSAIQEEIQEDATPVPLKQLLEQCPLPNQGRPSAGSMESGTALETLCQDVQDKLSWHGYQSRNAADDILKWYQGTGVWSNVDVGGCCWFLKLPHKDGSTHRVGNPLAKDFLNKFSENVLAGANAGAEKVLDISRKLSYWRNNHKRVEQQLVVWLGQKDLPRHLRESECEYGAIIPQVVVCGTLTRRAVEPTWMTASNAQKGRVGSELRAMVQAPPGYSIVGADVDSQELWIASVIGDAHFAKMHGATPLGWMTLSGCKADGTDMHSVTASAIGISRDHAKVINYARIYGAGQQFAERLLKQFNPAMSETEAKNKANKMFALTKGRRIFRLREEYRSVLDDRSYTMYEAMKIRSQHGLSVEEMFEHPRWVGGTESAMFNRLEEIANSPTPVTPFLSSRLSRALEPDSGQDDRYLPTRVNWVVQSGAVDFLHLMLVSMRWLQDPRTRFCLSFHDEVRYLVPQEQRYQAALAMHVTNLLVRAFCARRLGLFDLPQSVAFFASVEVDTVLRKEAHQDCITPSNPHGLLRGYGIPQGESLDIQQALQKAGHTLRLPGTKHKKRCLVPQRGSM